jgi:multidrug efflux pump subunit AcrB
MSMKRDIKMRRFLKNIEKFLTWAFDIPRRAILISISLPLLGFLLFNLDTKRFFPANDRDMFRIHIELPTNSSSTKPLKEFKKLRQQVIDSNLIELDRDYWFIGRWMPRVLMNIVGGEEKNGSTIMLKQFFLQKIIMK